MYAIVEQGSKQYKVAVGDQVEIELTDVAPDAKTIELDKVLFIGGEGSSRIGKPYIEGAKVVASFKSYGGRSGRQGQEALRHDVSQDARTARSESAIARSTCR